MRKSVVFSKADLRNLMPGHDFFVGIDSDGCVFDTMEIKQKRCFHKIIVEHWSLEPIEKYVRETAEFVNLYSRHRGNNRFVNLLLMFDLLSARPEAADSGLKLPDLKALEEFVKSGQPLGNPALEKTAEETGDSSLADVLAWSRAVNEDIARTVKNVSPFKWARESLIMIKDHADAICISQTPSEALFREWREHDLAKYVKLIAGQELGSKTEHLRLAAVGKYEPDKILIIGDAPGDMKAARDIGACFYPIIPGAEAESWRHFLDEGFDGFLAGAYSGEYEDGRIEEFEKSLPATPPW